MKKLLYPIAFALTTFLILYSCSAEEEDTTPPPTVQQPTPEPEPEVSQFTLTVTAEEGGTVSTEGGTYDEGTEVTITATPADGYEFVGWEGSDSTEASLTVTLGANTTLNALFSLSLFNSISEDFSSINKTTSYYNNQKYFDEYFSQDFLEGLTHYETHSRFRIFGPDIIVLDYDKDEKQDLIGFATSFCDEHPYSYHQGKFILMSDYKGKQNKLVFDSSFYFGVRLLAGDFNNDGYTDVVASSHDTKQNVFISSEDIGGFQNVLPTKPKIIDLRPSTPAQYEVGVEQDTHDFSAGDINNDGLMDFIQFPIAVYYNGTWDNKENEKPTISINNGDFTFTSYELIPDYDYEEWHCFSYELFDLNNDGALDIIVGHDIGAKKEEFSNPQQSFQSELLAPVILWGNNSGFYSLNNSTILEENTLSGSNRKSKVLGFGFTDYDTDGDIDIIVSTTRNELDANLGSGLYYQTYYLLSFENVGSKNFIESFIIGEPVDESMSSFTNFYHIKSVDFDKDGKVDIVPSGMANWGDDFYVDGLYWQNTGGQFEKRILD